MSQEIAKAVESLATTQAFSKPVQSLTVPEQVEAYAAAHFVEEVAKSRRESVRESLMKVAETTGIDNEKGGQKLTVGDFTVLRERRMSSTPDEKKLMTLLEKKGLSVEQAFDKVTVLQPNPSKVNALVESGHLTEDEGKALYKATYALIVHASSEFDALMENAVPAGVAPSKKTRR